VAPGVSVDEVKQKTAAEIDVASSVRTIGV